MTRSNKIVSATRKPTRTLPAATACKLAFMALLISMSLTACKLLSGGAKVISADQTLTRLQAGQAFRAQCDGWFMSDALYQRYRRAVADKILEEQSKPADQK